MLIIVYVFLLQLLVSVLATCDFFMTSNRLISVQCFIGQVKTHAHAFSYSQDLGTEVASV